MAVRELRLALAMRGGVSLAIWIGGACAEIDALRRAVGPPPDPPSPSTPSGLAFWDRVGQVSGYDDVVVDVMAGASAGGLNGVLYAASQAYGFSMDDMRDVWAELGDTERLLRRKATDITWPSLFRGDGYFFAALEAQLRKLAGDGQHAPSRPVPLDLRLSATFVDPVRRAGRSPSDEELVERRFASGFRFTCPAYPWLPTQLPPLAAQSGLGSPQAWSSRLALAARSTSSFPGAFEAAKITATRPSRFGDDVDPGSGLDVDMSGVLLDSGGPVDGAARFAVSDGGVLDNIPLGRALDAVAEAPADGPTDRFLLYLQPGVPSVPKGWSRRPDEHRETAWSVLRGALSSRMPAENIFGDLQQLDLYNSRVDQAAALRRSTFASIKDPDDLQATAGRTWDSYRVLRSEEDRRSIVALLDDPVVTLGEDPFPRTVAGHEVSDACWRSPLDHTLISPWSGKNLPSRERLASALHEEFFGRLAPTWSTDDGIHVWRVGVRPVLRVTQLLLEWAQHLEGRGATEASPCKVELYRIATFLRVAVDRPRQLGWVTVAATHAASKQPGTERALVQTTLRALKALVHPPAEEVSLIVTALHGDDTDSLTALVTARLRALDDLTEGWDVQADRPSPGREDGAGKPGRTDLRIAVVNDLLVPVARSLAEISGGLGREADGDATSQASPGRDPGWYLDRALTGATRSELTGRDLAALEVVAFLEFATGLPTRRHVRLKRISSQSETPLAPYLSALLKEAEARDTWWDPSEKLPKRQRGIHVNLKLAGDAVANFSAFLDERWRVNDWMWGRLDAVPTLLELLITPGSLRSWLSGRTDRLEAVEELVLGPEDADDDGLRAFLLEHVWTEQTRTLVEAELDALGSTRPQGEDAAVVAETRRALVTARQWEIVATEDAVTAGRDTRRDPEWPGPGLLEAVRHYDVGAESFGHPRVRKAVSKRLRGILWVAGRVVAYNTVEHAPRKDPEQASRKAVRWGRRSRIAIQLASWPVARRMTRPREGQN